MGTKTVNTKTVNTTPDHTTRAIRDGEGNGFVLYSADVRTGEGRAKFLSECAAEYLGSCFDHLDMDRVPVSEVIDTVLTANTLYCEPPLSEEDVNAIVNEVLVQSSARGDGYISMSTCNGPSPVLSIGKKSIYFRYMSGGDRVPYLKNTAALIQFLSKNTDMGYPDLEQRKEFVMDVNKHYCKPPLPELMVSTLADEILASED
ncbi:hypothetical protein [Paratractidigestivibacter sp.]|uniref:hypothetical protein n=1 Tax=Paratractidigestivibacter sp. TaxID=2847316 RepID=UPI002AC969E9|nr:hypothetical protein [Paratractidigestivibacter sp.]